MEFNLFYITTISEVAANKHNSLPNKNLLVLGNLYLYRNILFFGNFLGDRDSGKTTLLAKLQGNEDPKKGSGLDFNYIDVRDEECEEHTLLGMSVLDGDEAHANLLKFALSESNYRDTTVMICTSMATPWAIMDQLTKWMTVLQVHLHISFIHTSWITRNCNEILSFLLRDIFSSK